MTPDAVDLALLRALLADGSLTAKAAGEAAGVSQPVAWRRIKRMEAAGIIKGWRVRLDAKKLGYEVTVFVGIKMARAGRASLEDFERAAAAVPEVQLIQHVLGVYDYRLRVVARDLADFERILRRRIMTLPGVGEVESNVLLSEEKAEAPRI